MYSKYWFNYHNILKKYMLDFKLYSQIGITHNVRDIRSFSGTKWRKNLGEAPEQLTLEAVQ